MVVRRVAIGWSAAGLVGCVVVTLLSFVTSVPPLPMAFADVVAVGAVVSFVIAVVAGFEGRRVANADHAFPTRVVAGVPVPGDVGSWIVLAGFVLALVSAGSALSSLPGTPELLGGRYVFDDHGHITTTSAVAYRQGIRASQRLMVSVPAVFHLVALVMTHWSGRASRRGGTDPRFRRIGIRTPYLPKRR